MVCVFLRKRKVVKRLQQEGWEGAGDATDTPNVTYRHFLALLWGIKGEKMAKRSIGRRIWDAIAARYNLFAPPPRLVIVSSVDLSVGVPYARISHFDVRCWEI